MQNEASWKEHERRLVRTIVRAAGRIAGRAAALDGGRRPVSWLEDEFFTALADEIESMGVRRRVAAGMFGSSRRTFQRRLGAAYENLGQIGSSVWWLVHDELAERSLSDEQISAKFPHCPPDVLVAIVRDMVDSGWAIEANGKYSANSTTSPWSKERLTQFVNAERLSTRELSAVTLARISGLSVEQVREWVDEQTADGRVLDAQNEAKWGVLNAVARTALYIVFRRLASDDGADAKFWRVQYAEANRDEVDEIRSSVASKGGELDDTMQEFFGRLATGRTDLASSAYEVMICEADVDDPLGWTSI